MKLHIFVLCLCRGRRVAESACDLVDGRRECGLTPRSRREHGWRCAWRLSHHRWECDGPVTAVSAAGYPLQTTLGGARVRIVHARGSIDCPILYASRRQINAVVPSSTPIGMATVQVVLDGEASPEVPLRVVPSDLFVFRRLPVIRTIRLGSKRQGSLIPASAASGEGAVLSATGC